MLILATLESKSHDVLFLKAEKGQNISLFSALFATYSLIYFKFAIRTIRSFQFSIQFELNVRDTVSASFSSSVLKEAK